MVTAFAAACHEFVEPEINDVLDDSRLISVNLSQAQTKITDEDIYQQRFVVYIYVDGEEAEFQNPYNLVYDEDQKRWRFQKSGNWVDLFWNETGEHQFYAYNDKQYTNLYWNNDVSYNWNGGNPTINLGDIDLTDGSNLYSFDLIYTKVVHDVESKGYGSITLEFSHAFSSLLFEVKNEYPEPITIKKVSISNIRMTSGKDVSLSFASGLGEQSSGADVYSSGEFTIDEKQSAFAFGGAILVWPQWYQGSHPFFTLTIKDNDVDDNNDKSKIISLDDINIGSLIRGTKYHSTITLAPMSLDLEVKELVREYVGGALKSKLTLSLSADKDLSEISDLQITVNKKGGESLGTYTIGTVSSNEVVVEGVADMKEGVYYTISYSFKDGIGHAYNGSFDHKAETPPPAQQEFNYIYADGSQGNDVNGDIVGVIIFRGDPKEEFNDPELPDEYCNGLAISVENVITTWAYNKLTVSIPAAAKVSSTNNPASSGGYTIKKVWVDNGFDLPIYNNSSYKDLSNCNTSGWYLPTKNELDHIKRYQTDINKLLTDAGLDEVAFGRNGNSENAVWLPLLYSSSNNAVVCYENYNSELSYTNTYHYTYTRTVRPIFAF